MQLSDKYNLFNENFVFSTEKYQNLINDTRNKIGNKFCNIIIDYETNYDNNCTTVAGFLTSLIIIAKQLNTNLLASDTKIRNFKQDLAAAEKLLNYSNYKNFIQEIVNRNNLKTKTTACDAHLMIQLYSLGLYKEFNKAYSKNNFHDKEYITYENVIFKIPNLNAELITEDNNFCEKIWIIWRLYNVVQTIFDNQNNINNLPLILINIHIAILSEKLSGFITFDRANVECNSFAINNIPINLILVEKLFFNNSNINLPSLF